MSNGPGDSFFAPIASAVFGIAIGIAGGFFVIGVLFSQYYMKSEFENSRYEIEIPLSPDPAMEIDLEELRCLALNIYYEARNDSYAGKYSVADVVLNRIQHTRYPDTICEVVMEAKMSENWTPIKNQCQFSWYCDGKPDTPTNEIAWKESEGIARNILTSGKFRGITEGSTHYHALYVTPKWIGDVGMHAVGVIGLHSFYRRD